MKKKLFILLLISLVIIQCKKDDDTISEYEAREYSDQVIDDQIALEEYLQSHTYNYEDFNSDSNIDVDIKFLGDNSTELSLFDMASVQSIDVPDANGENVPHNLYYIIARDGIKENPFTVYRDWDKIPKEWDRNPTDEAEKIAEQGRNALEKAKTNLKRVS